MQRGCRTAAAPIPLKRKNKRISAAGLTALDICGKWTLL
jgi:hypothetical protein